MTVTQIVRDPIPDADKEPVRFLGGVNRSGEC